MLRRVLLALLTLCLALPAALPAAVPVPQVHTMAMPMHHSDHSAPANDQGDHAGKYQCIGCAVTLDRSPPPVRRLAIRAAPIRPTLVTGLPEARAGPETPPPRA